ncbi:MAG: helicase-related protein [Trueperaceae bacterium]|nr:helicase-related protein [Trueperaceae bacterium]
MSYAFQPGTIVKARGRLWRVDTATATTLTGTRLDSPEAPPHTFFLPLEGSAITLESMDYPPRKAGDATLHDLFLRATRLTMMHGTAPLASLQRSRVIPTNYQLVPVMMALDMPRVRLLVADDVGLGKTIETGLITVELLARKQIERVLVLTPANLRAQWQEAFAHFFHLDAEILSTPNLRRLGRKLPPGANPWAHFPFVIASIDYAKQDSVKNLILAQDWDLVIIDEAHGVAATVTGARGGGRKDRYDFASELARQVDHLILATATPHNGYTTSFASLLRMLDEREVQGRITAPLGLVGGELDEPHIYRERAKRHVVQRRREDVMAWFEREDKKSPFPKRDSKEVFIEPSKPEREVYVAFQAYQKFVFGEVGAENVHVLAKWMMMHFLRRATSSPRALKESLRNRIGRLEERLEPSPLDPNDPNDAPIKSALLDLGGDDHLPEEEADSKLDRLSILDRAHLRAEIGFLEEVLKAVERWRPGSDTKLKKLRELLRDPGHLGANPRTILFTRYVDTLTYLKDELSKEDNLAIFTVDGSLSEAARLEHLSAFQNSAQNSAQNTGTGTTESRAILIATDSISEGLNLQFAANQLVHYELPWNPNRLEQRNGRVDRFGQPKPEVRIRTLINNRSFDLVVFQRLIQKAQKIRDEYGFVPSYFSDERHVESLFTDLIDEKLVQHTFQQPNMFDPQGDTIDDADRAEADKIRDESFYGQAAFNLPDVEARLQETQDTIGSPAEVEQLVVDALRLLDWRVTPQGERVYQIVRASGEPIEGVADNLGTVTFDPDVALRDPRHQQLDVAHPLVTKLLRLIKQRSYLGASSARTAVSVRVLPDGTSAHAVFHVRARFRVGDEGDGAQLIEGLIPVAIDLEKEVMVARDTAQRLIQAPKPEQDRKFSDAMTQQLIDFAHEVSGLDAQIEAAVEAEAERLREERRGLKARLLDAYPNEAGWLRGIDNVTPATHDVLALTVIVPAR